MSSSLQPPSSAKNSENDVSSANPMITTDDAVKDLFRPAKQVIHDADHGDPQPHDQQKKRKSLGRRVSFAATAHVRVFEKDPAIAPEVKKSAAPVKSEFEPSPLRRKSLEDFRLEEIASPGNRFTASPVRSESFEVHLKENLTSSSNEIEEDEDDLCSEDEMIVAEEETEMDFTNCVGGIISNFGGFKSNNDDEQYSCSSSADEQANDEENEDRTMDITKCVGGILHNACRSPTPSTTASSVDTMELTMCVGGIVRPLGSAPATGRESLNSSLTEDLVDFESNDMEMTVCVGKISTVGSPSPFLLNGRDDEDAAMRSPSSM